MRTPTGSIYGSLHLHNLFQLAHCFETIDTWMIHGSHCRKYALSSFFVAGCGQTTPKHMNPRWMVVVCASHHFRIVSHHFRIANIPHNIAVLHQILVSEVRERQWQYQQKCPGDMKPGAAKAARKKNKRATDAKWRTEIRATPTLWRERNVDISIKTRLLQQVRRSRRLP